MGIESFNGINTVFINFIMLDIVFIKNGIEGIDKFILYTLYSGKIFTKIQI